MNPDVSRNPPAEDRVLPTELTALPPLPWKEGIEVVLARYERRMLEHALSQANGVKRRAAMLLGISRYALERRLTRVARTLDEGVLADSGDDDGGDDDRREERASTATGDH